MASGLGGAVDGSRPPLSHWVGGLTAPKRSPDPCSGRPRLATGLRFDVELKRLPMGVIRDSRAPEPVWALSMKLMVGCWCRDNHNAHYVVTHLWDVGTIDALAERAQAAYSIVEGWISTSVDADHWRRPAGSADHRRAIALLEDSAVG